MNIFIEVLVACVILFCVTLGLFIQYKEDSKSEFEKLPAFDYSYSTDCLDYNEFICLYRFVVYYVKRNKLPRHISLQEFCLLIDFLCRSRFAGHLGHDKVEGINFIYLIQVFVKISHKVRGSYLSDGISSDSYSAKEFIRLRGHYMSELQGFYELNGLNYCVPRYQFAQKHLLDDLYFCEEKEQTLF